MEHGLPGLALHLTHRTDTAAACALGPRPADPGLLAACVPVLACLVWRLRTLLLGQACERRPPCTPPCSFAVFFGISMAGSIRISQALGAGCPKLAQRATWAGLALTLALIACLLAALLALQVGPRAGRGDAALTSL